MDQIIKHITGRLVHQLPEEKEAFKLKDLQEYGFPRFVVKRIQIELERNLAESIILPETEWADMESEDVQHAWDQFVSAIRAQALLPHSYVQPVTETAINDIMEILVQPRKNLPDVIYGASDSLEYSDLADRVDAIVVYRHFSSLIPRYMEKKELDELTKERCSKIITQADEKLTAHYSPLNWAQMLEPLFILTEEQIDSNLLRLFFEDKNKPRLARRFDMINDSLNRSELIEVLSTPDLKDDDEQNELFNPQVTPPKKRETETDTEELDETVEQEDISLGTTVSDIDVASVDTRDTEKQPDEDDNKEDNDEEGSFLNTISGESEEMTEEQEKTQVDEGESASALNEIFSDDGPENGNEYSDSEASGSFEELENEGDGTDQISEENEESEKAAAEEDQDNEEDKEETDNRAVIAENGSEPEEETPMWQRFMDSSDLEVEEEDIPEETPEHKENEYEEEPIIDLTKQDEPDEEIYNQLFDLLKNDRNRFVEEIFRGGDEAYEEAIKEIATKENWREASQFIEKEVFKRNLVDMYSEVAVDFTDQLQTYFIKTTKSN